MGESYQMVYTLKPPRVELCAQSTRKGIRERHTRTRERALHDCKSVSQNKSWFQRVGHLVEYLIDYVTNESYQATFLLKPTRIEHAR